MMETITIPTARKIIDELFTWKGFGYPHEQRHVDFGWLSFCRIRLYQGLDSTIILATDVDDEEKYPDGTGTSITNSAENLIRLVVERYQLDPKHLTLIEHYPERGNYRERFEECFSLVEFDYDGKLFSRPRWQPLLQADVIALTGDPDLSPPRVRI